MIGFLLDTNVVSEPIRPRPESAVIRWLGQLDDHQQFISVVSIAEIEVGRDAAPSAKREMISEWLRDEIRPFFADRTVELDESVLRAAIRLNMDGRRRGQTYAFADLLIGASAAAREVVLATRNVRNFLPMGIPLFDPWSIA